jgi:hypothetical protein
MIVKNKSKDENKFNNRLNNISVIKNLVWKTIVTFHKIIIYPFF